MLLLTRGAALRAVARKRINAICAVMQGKIPYAGWRATDCTAIKQASYRGPVETSSSWGYPVEGLLTELQEYIVYGLRPIISDIAKQSKLGETNRSHPSRNGEILKSHLLFVVSVHVTSHFSDRSIL